MKFQTGLPRLPLYNYSQKINTRDWCCVFTCNLLDVLIIGPNGFKQYGSQPHLPYYCTTMKRPNSVCLWSRVIYLKGSKQNHKKKQQKHIYSARANSLGSNLYTEWFHRLIIKWHVSRPTFTMASIPPNSGTVQRRSRLTLPQLSGEALSGRRLGNPVGRMSRQGLLPFGGGSNPCRMA